MAEDAGSGVNDLCYGMAFMMNVYDSCGRDLSLHLILHCISFLSLRLLL